MAYNVDKKPFWEELGALTDRRNWRCRSDRTKVWEPDDMVYLDESMVDLYWQFFMAGWRAGASQEAADAKARARRARAKKARAS